LTPIFQEFLGGLEQKEEEKRGKESWEELLFRIAGIDPRLYPLEASVNKNHFAEWQKRYSIFKEGQSARRLRDSMAYDCLIESP